MEWFIPCADEEAIGTDLFIIIFIIIYIIYNIYNNKISMNGKSKNLPVLFEYLNT